MNQQPDGKIYRTRFGGKVWSFYALSRHTALPTLSHAHQPSSCPFGFLWDLHYIGVCMVSHSVMSDFFDPIDCSPPGSSVHGILQARILE